jgi:hypothetical protein
MKISRIPFTSLEFIQLANIPAPKFTTKRTSMILLAPLASSMKFLLNGAGQHLHLRVMPCVYLQQR